MEDIEGLKLKYLHNLEKLKVKEKRAKTTNPNKPLNARNYKSASLRGNILDYTTAGASSQCY